MNVMVIAYHGASVLVSCPGHGLYRMLSVFSAAAHALASSAPSHGVTTCINAPWRYMKRAGAHARASGQFHQPS